MPIKRITPKGAAKAYLDKQLAMWQQTIINNLVYVGESALKQAREGHRYKDQTGNLTSSIGYAIVVDGKVFKRSRFEVVNNGREGAANGSQFLQRIIARNSKGIVFIMVAGMPYAQYVEAMSLDVLDSAEVMAKKMLPNIFKALKLQ